MILALLTNIYSSTKPTSFIPSNMASFQFSPVRNWKIVSMDTSNESNRARDECGIVSPTSCMPAIAEMNM